MHSNHAPFDQRLGEHVNRTQGYFVVRNRGAMTRYGQQHSTQERGMKMPRTEEELSLANERHDNAEVVLLIDGFIIGVIKNLESPHTAAIGFKLDKSIEVLRVKDFYAKYGRRGGQELAKFHRTKLSGSSMMMEINDYGSRLGS